MDAGAIGLTKSHGSGLPPWEFRQRGSETVIEDGVLVFHPENILIGDRVYVGHQAILKGYYKNQMIIGNGCWIGQQCFFHSAGGITLGQNVGVGPGVKILTSSHVLDVDTSLPIMQRPLKFAPVLIGDGCDIGVNAVILPGVNLGALVQVGAGAVVNRSFPAGAVLVGIPARQIN